MVMRTEANLNAAPRHPHAKRILQERLLTGVASFEELEARIAALPTQVERGAAFEVFAEGWFATQRIAQARQIWPGDSPPLSLQEKLRLPLRDMGVDGIVET